MFGCCVEVLSLAFFFACPLLLLLYLTICSSPQPSGPTKNNPGNVLLVIGLLGQVLQAGAGDPRGALPRLFRGFR